MKYDGKISLNALHYLDFGRGKFGRGGMNSKLDQHAANPWCAYIVLLKKTNAKMLARVQILFQS